MSSVEKIKNDTENVSTDVEPRVLPGFVMGCRGVDGCGYVTVHDSHVTVEEVQDDGSTIELEFPSDGQRFVEGEYVEVAHVVLADRELVQLVPVATSYNPHWGSQMLQAS